MYGFNVHKDFPHCCLREKSGRILPLPHIHSLGVKNVPLWKSGKNKVIEGKSVFKSSLALFRGHNEWKVLSSDESKAVPFQLYTINILLL